MTMTSGPMDDTLHNWTSDSFSIVTEPNQNLTMLGQSYSYDVESRSTESGDGTVYSRKWTVVAGGLSLEFIQCLTINSDGTRVSYCNGDIDAPQRYEYSHALDCTY